MKPFTALTIAGSDSGGGAGIQADIKTFEEWRVYGMSVLTSLTAQNTTGVQDVHHVPVSFIDTQLATIEEDLPIDVIKTGMIATREAAETVGRWIARQNVPYVCDPVMVSASGHPLMEAETRTALSEFLFPYATVVTPNIPEAETLLEMEIKTEADMEKAARRFVDELGARGALVKGGHLDGEAVDVLYDGEAMHTYREDRISTENTHGTGCTYASAIAANLAMGRKLPIAVEEAKAYVTEAIRHSFDIGAGSGPLTIGLTERSGYDEPGRITGNTTACPSHHQRSGHEFLREWSAGLRRESGDGERAGRSRRGCKRRERTCLEYRYDPERRYRNDGQSGTGGQQSRSPRTS